MIEEKIFRRFRCLEKRKRLESKTKKNNLEIKTKNGNILNLRPKKYCFEFKTKKGDILSSLMKTMKTFRRKNGFLFNIAGNDTPQTGENAYCRPELWNINSEISPRVYRVESAD